MPAKHYPLGGSTAHIWTKCPAMPTMVRFAQDVPAGEAAERGTRIHALAEAFLKNEQIVGQKSEIDIAEQYANAVRSKFGSNYSVEREYVGDNGYYGTTIDGLSHDKLNNILWVWDLKSGNEQVSPENNKQLLFCLLMVVLHMSKQTDCVPHTFNLGIWQDGMFKWWAIDKARARKETDLLIEAIERTQTSKIACNPGEHCHYAKCKNVCAAYSNYLQPIARQAYKGDPVTFTPDELAAFQDQAKAVRAWLDSLEDYNLALAKEGRLPGYEVGQGKARPAIWKNGARLPEILYEKKLLTPAQAKTVLSSEEVDALSERPKPNEVLRRKDAKAAELTEW